MDMPHELIKMIGEPWNVGSIAHVSKLMIDLLLTGYCISLIVNRYIINDIKVDRSDEKIPQVDNVDLMVSRLKTNMLHRCKSFNFRVDLFIDGDSFKGVIYVLQEWSL